MDILEESTRCLLVHPRFSDRSFWNYSEVCAFTGAKYPAAPLGLMTVAALLPQHWQFRLVDENVRPLTQADLESADLVCTGGMLPQQSGIMTVINRAHENGKRVVVGGPDPTSQPSIYGDADFLVLGEGEVAVPLLIEALARNEASGQYHSPQRADMGQAVVPRFDLIRFGDYLHVGIQFSRGCPYNCEFCNIIELYGRRPRTKTTDQVLAELQTLYELGYRGHVDFVDDNFIGNKSKVIPVLEAVRDWSAHRGYPFYFSTEATIDLAKHDKLLSLMQQIDFRYVFIGIESPDEEVLVQTQKLQNRGISVVDAVERFVSHGIIVNGGFVLGFDSEKESTAGNLMHLIQESGICMAMVGTLFALPDTQLSRRLEREGRLFSAGSAIQEDGVDIDQTTSGLNFATIRPRTSVLGDQLAVLNYIYAPDQYYDRVLRTATHLVPSLKNRPNPAEALRLLWPFLKVCWKAGCSRRGGQLYWQTLWKVLKTNPKAIEAAVNLSAMYVHFSKQSDFVIRMLEEKIEQVNRCGEGNYNDLMCGSLNRI